MKSIHLAKMKYIILTLTAVLCLAMVNSHPLPEDGLQSETLDRLVMAEADDEAALRSKRTIGILRQFFPEATQNVNPESENRVNEIGTAESQNSEVRVQFADEVPSENSPQELTPLDELETNDDENRNKRFLFNFGGGAGGAGSGNFLFDIVRQAADGAARAAGTVYRVVAGTQSLGLGLSASRDLGPAAQQGPAFAGANPAGVTGTPTSGAPSTAAAGAGILPLLVVGSGSSSPTDTSGTATAGRTDGTQEAVPGPVTRFFVLANRGFSNLIQDLILRLAATSERIVNFKARLITSII